MITLRYDCDLSNNSIVFECCTKTKIALMDKATYDEKIPKMFFFVLRDSIEDLEKKGYTKICQKVSREEYDECLKDNKKWQIIYEDKTGMLIECNIEDSLECIAMGFSVEKIFKD